MDFDNFNFEDDSAYDITESLKEQVKEQMETDMRSEYSSRDDREKPRYRILKVLSCVVLVLIAFAAFLVFTRPGRKIAINAASSYAASKLDYDLDASDGNQTPIVSSDKGREEDYVTNFLIFGIEEIGGAKNTDSMIIASINTKTDKITLTSLMRDTYVSVPGWKKTKLNAAYAHGGIQLLIDTIEENFYIHIDGYASVNFDSFEKVIDQLGGVSIELSQKEANYLNTTNYISNPANRHVKKGMNTLNGNQALGYCRVRYVSTIEGVANDQGRTLRQRKVLSAIFDKFKSQNLFAMMNTVNSCLSYVSTNVVQKQISDALEAVVENKITTLNINRMPYDGMYEAPKKYEQTTWPLVLDMDANIKEFYKDVYGDTEEEAAIKLDEQKSKAAMQ